MPVKSRRPSREAALRALYQMEVGGIPKREAIRTMTEDAELEPAVLAYASELIEGVVDEIEGIDKILSAKLRDWSLDRLAILDRNILRMGAYEIYFRPEIPPAVTLNEAVEIAKKYSTAESGKFVNGVLGAVLADSPKAQWDRAAAPPESQWEEPAPPEIAPEPELIEEGSDAAHELSRAAKWTIRAEEPS